MATRLLNQKPQYRLADGSLCAGGSLNFYDTGTTTPKSVYGEEALSTDLGSSLTLDSAGRTTPDVWLDGDYRVILKDADDATIWTLDDVNDLATATAYAVPDPASGADGQAILTDGTDFYLADLIQVPDPTGHSGEQLGTDGTLTYWEAKQTIPTYTATSLPGGIAQGSTSFQIGKLLVQFGSDSAATASAEYTTDSVTFPTAYATLLHVACSPTGSSGFTTRGTGVSQQIAGSTTGFTVRFSAGNEHGASDWNITTAVTYTWVAFGLVA